MGATICFANFFAVLDWILASGGGINLSFVIKIFTYWSLLLQHFIIVRSLRWVKTVYGIFCKKEPTETSDSG